MNRLFGHIANIILIAVMLIPIQLAQAAPPEPSGAAIAAPSSLSGILGIIWGDPQDRRVSPRTDFFITPDGGSPVRLEMGARLPLPMARLLSLNGKHISIQGQWLSSGATEQRFQVEGLGSEAGSAEMATTAVTGPQPWVTVLCKFNDFPNDEPKPVSYFNGMYSNSFPGIDHYWREVSYGLINVSGSQVVTHWYTLPHPRSYYVYPVNGNLYFNHQLATNDCTAAADADIYYPQFVGINLMFNYELDNYAWGGSAGTTLDGVSRLWRFTWEPPWGYENIAVIAHETGHGFGLPHSSGQYGETYDNQWDIMSDTWTNCNNLRDGTYGCVGQATISYHRYLEGWIPPPGWLPSL